MRNVTRQFPLDTVDHHELIGLFLSHFGRGGGVHQRSQKFFRDGSPHFVLITASTEGQLTKIEASDNFPSEDLQALLQEVRTNLVDNQAEAAGAGVLFCQNSYVKGYFQYRDRFLISPMPPASPQPPYIVGDHAFAIRFNYRSSPDKHLSLRRRHAHTIEYGRYLNILLGPRIGAGSRFNGFGWAMDLTDPNNVTSRWTQMGYIPVGLEAGALPLKPPEGVPELVRIAKNTYYGDPFAGANDLTIPDNLEQSLDLVLALSGERRRQFDVAAAWLDQSGDIWRGSGSASFAAMVIAIEALLEPRPGEVCDCCKQPKYATTRRFKEFLMRHVPGIDNYPTVLQRLYRVRSGIVHGADLFEQDQYPWRYMPSIRGQEEVDLFSTTHQLVRVAVINWLTAGG